MLYPLVLLLALSLPSVLAFSDTVPVVAWSSHSSNVLDAELDGDVRLLETILFHDDICDNDAVILVGQSGLHASDLRTLPPTSRLAQSLSSAPSSRQYPYVRSGLMPTPLVWLAESISQRCRSRFVRLDLGSPLDGIEREKHVVCIDMPHLDAVSTGRKDIVAEQTSRLSEDLAHIGAAFPKHLVIYTGTPASSLPLSKRQSAGAHLFAPGNSTLASGSILHRYQLLTPALITGLLVTFFVVVPIIIVGIRALSSIQSPLRVEGIKGYSAIEKKNN